MCMIGTDTSDEHNGPKQEVSTKQDYPVSSSIIGSCRYSYQSEVLGHAV